MKYIHVTFTVQVNLCIWEVGQLVILKLQMRGMFTGTGEQAALQELVFFKKKN